MERRSAATVVGAAAATVLATVLGLGATFGLFGLTEPTAGGAATDRVPAATMAPVHTVGVPGAAATAPMRDD